MNYAVHAIMYFYYFLMAVKMKPKWFNSIYITVSQISQMVVGVTVTILGFLLAPKFEKECALKSENNVAALIMYGSYLLLFVQFFAQRYLSKSSKSKSKPKKQD
jgi:elongation of very long chain fatty acids protein 6